MDTLSVFSAKSGPPCSTDTPSSESDQEYDQAGELRGGRSSIGSRLVHTVRNQPLTSATTSKSNEHSGSGESFSGFPLISSKWNSKSEYDDDRLHNKDQGSLRSAQEDHNYNIVVVKDESSFDVAVDINEKSENYWSNRVSEAGRASSLPTYMKTSASHVNDTKKKILDPRMGLSKRTLFKQPHKRPNLEERSSQLEAEDTKMPVLEERSLKSETSIPILENDGLFDSHDQEDEETETLSRTVKSGNQHQYCRSSVEKPEDVASPIYGFQNVHLNDDYHHQMQQEKVQSRVPPREPSLPIGLVNQTDVLVDHSMDYMHAEGYNVSDPMASKKVVKPQGVEFFEWERLELIRKVDELRDYLLKATPPAGKHPVPYTKPGWGVFEEQVNHAYYYDTHATRHYPPGDSLDANRRVPFFPDRMTGTHQGRIPMETYGHGPISMLNKERVEEAILTVHPKWSSGTQYLETGCSPDRYYLPGHHEHVQRNQELNISQRDASYSPRERSPMTHKSFYRNSNQTGGDGMSQRSRSSGGSLDDNAESSASSPIERFPKHAKDALMYYDEKHRQQKFVCAASGIEPIDGGAPFVVCDNCFQLLRLPNTSCLSLRINKVKCGACSAVVGFSLHSQDSAANIWSKISDADILRKHQHTELEHQKNLGASRKVRREQADVNMESPQSAFSKLISGVPLHMHLGYSTASGFLREC